MTAAITVIPGTGKVGTLSAQTVVAGGRLRTLPGIPAPATLSLHS